MLYDPKWEQKTASDLFSLESLVRWLGTQDTNARYEYCRNGGCMLANYFHANGYPNAIVGGDYVRLDGGHYDSRKRTALPLSFMRIAAMLPYTYGAALERAIRVMDD